MISPSKIVERVGPGGRLVPFFKSVCVYFLAVGGGETPSLAAAAFKCAPVLSLALFVLLYHGGSLHRRGEYARRVLAGLLLSAVGDALLVWPQYFVGGMAAFGAAHACYVAAFGWRPRRAALGAAVCAAGAAAALQLAPPEPLRLAVPLYSALLATMCWRALARVRGRRDAPRLAAALGSLLFLLSDAILGFNLFHSPIPHKQLLVMSTYYLAQFGIALSVLEPRDAPAKPPAAAASSSPALAAAAPAH